MKIIFKHIPKTAGESTRQIMPDETIFIGHNYYHPEYKHLYYDTKKYLQKFVIAFVRNPYDRVVSAFHYLNAGGNNDADQNDKKKYIEKYYGNFNFFVKDAFPGILSQIHFMPQHSWIYFNKVNLCNFVGKYEELQEDIGVLSKTIGLKSTKFPELNKSIHKPYKEYYTEKTKNIIYKHYEVDFRLFGYKEELG